VTEQAAVLSNLSCEESPQQPKLLWKLEEKMKFIIHDEPTAPSSSLLLANQGVCHAIS
jgi:hypothetical protein